MKTISEFEIDAVGGGSIYLFLPLAAYYVPVPSGADAESSDEAGSEEATSN